MEQQAWVIAMLCAVMTATVRAERPAAIPNDRLLNDNVTVHRRSADTLWVYDNRPETGIGTHLSDLETLKQIWAAGIRLVRMTMYWYEFERTTTPGEYDAGALAAWDATIQRCDELGLVPQVVVHGNPPGVDYAHREAGYRRYAHFVADMARRYPTIRFWELFNEMDAGFTDLFGAMQPDVPMRQRGRMYAEMLAIAYPAIKSANPNAWILLGGMTDWTEFPRGVYEAGGGDYFDFMNLHTYGVPLHYGFVERGLALFALMREFRDENRPIWNTEFGIDAGSIAQAWGLPHTWQPPQDDGDAFDRIQMESWRDVLEDNQRRRLYVKALGYQFFATEVNDPDILEKAKLPEGRTLGDYSFGVVRSDQRTPRPTYDWLVQSHDNAPLIEHPSRVIDVNVYLADGAVPVDYPWEDKWRKPWIVIRNVTVGTLEPTVIQLKRP